MTFNLTGGVVVSPDARIKVDPETSGITLLDLDEQSFLPWDRQQWSTLGQGDNFERYRRRKNERKRNTHWGQLKLLISEIEFLNLYWDPKEVENPVLIYVGAASGQHIAVLADLFPQFEYHLYDPRPFNAVLSTKKKITLYNQLFGEDDAKKWAKLSKSEKKKKGRSNIFFVVDIRNPSYKRLESPSEDDFRESQELVWGDVLLQQGWVEQIEPHYFSLKFRLPYTYSFNIDPAKGGAPTRKYLDGLVYLQPWAPGTSTETRLVNRGDAGLSYREWDIRAYEEMNFFHNSEVREKYKFKNPLLSPDDPRATQPPSTKLGLLNDWDSSLTLSILIDYMEKIGSLPSDGEERENQVLALAAVIIQQTNLGYTSLVGIRAGRARDFVPPPDEILGEEDLQDED